MPDETIEERLQTLETLQNTLVSWVRRNRSTKIDMLKYFESLLTKVCNTLGDFQIDLIKTREALQDKQKEAANK